MTAPAPGRMATPVNLPLADIKVGARLRQDLGDLDGLRASIAEAGLFQPVLVDSEGNLLAGLRRLRAAESLGWTHIPAVVLGGPRHE